jgi:hypothetical protein
MKLFNSLRTSLVLLGTLGVCIAVFLAGVGWWSQQRMNEAATSALIGKDVVADILPPAHVPHRSAAGAVPSPGRHADTARSQPATQAPAW